MLGEPKTSYLRFYKRIRTWEKYAKYKVVSFPLVRHYFWWLVHNIPAHLLIALVPMKFAFDFHDWTSKKLSGKHYKSKFIEKFESTKDYKKQEEERKKKSEQWEADLREKCRKRAQETRKKLQEIKSLDIPADKWYLLEDEIKKLERSIKTDEEF